MNVKTIAERLAAIGVELQNISAELQSGDPEVPPEALLLAKNGICLMCRKPIDKKVLRGCHEGCYKEMKEDIRLGVKTEKQLISEGRMLPKKPGGRKKERQYSDDTSALNEFLRSTSLVPDKAESFPEDAHPPAKEQ